MAHCSSEAKARGRVFGSRFLTPSSADPAPVWDGTSNVTGDFANGKLKAATRHNWHDRFGINAHVIETYTYGGRGGRVSARSTAIDEYSIASGNLVAHKQWNQGWTWNDLGQPLTLTYPSCQAGTACASYPPPALTVTQDYTNGWLTSSRNQSSYYYGNLIGYHPNGMFRTVTHGNGVVTAFQADPNKMTRPSSITATFGTTTYWSTGAYGYDGSGNIKSIGSDTNIYDTLSRILEGTVEAGSKKQSYTYDPYGNITRIITRINGVVNTDHTMNVSTATNRIQSTGGIIVAGYDVIVPRGSSSFMSITSGRRDGSRTRLGDRSGFTWTIRSAANRPHRARTPSG